MKPISLLSLLCADVVFGASLGTNREIQKRQEGLSGLMGIIGGMAKTGGKVYGGRVRETATTVAAKRTILKSDSLIPGVKRIKLRTGPYLVGSMNTRSQTNKKGMLESYYDNDIEKPCAGDCNILRQVGGLGKALPNCESLTISPD
jgi:hypothetical protein